MTNPEIPEEAVEAAWAAYRQRLDSGTGAMPREAFYPALAAALPHLRVQETDGRQGNQRGSGKACDCPACAPHPRTVVDREALLAVLDLHKVFTWMPMSTKALDAGRASLADAVLALLPTEEGEGS